MNVITIIEILGTFSFAVAGAFAAIERRLDPFGILIISFVTSIGGGTIRDILIGAFPVSWLSNSVGIWVILIGAIATMFFGRHLRKIESMLFLFDAIGLGFFTLVGIQKGIDHGLSNGLCIMLGTITGCFGGVLRDILLNNVPLIFHKEIYATASVVGGILFFVLLKLEFAENLCYVSGILTVSLLRILAVRFNWSLPKFYSKSIL